MIITLDKVENARKEGKWGKIDITYTRDGGKPSKRTLVAVGDTKKVIDLFRQDGAVGKTYDVTIEKDGDFYNWVDAKEAESAPAEAKKAYQAKSTYETPEERAARNVSICRQNALTNAVAFLSAKEGKATPEQVIELARRFASFTTGLDDLLEAKAEREAIEEEAAPAAPKKNTKAKEDFDDDIPF